MYRSMSEVSAPQVCQENIEARVARQMKRYKSIKAMADAMNKYVEENDNYVITDIHGGSEFYGRIMLELKLAKAYLKMYLKEQKKANKEVKKSKSK